MSIAEPVITDVGPPRLKMTIDEFLAVPDDGVDRMLLDGEVWELGTTMRNRSHGKVTARITTRLSIWNETQPTPRGEVTAGDTGFWLRGEPGSMVGPDVAYASADLVANTPDELAYYQGPPVLAVEVLSPSDKLEDIVAKVFRYLEVGTIVWEVNSHFRRVHVHRPGLPVESYNITQELVGDPYLPGFRVTIADIFNI